MDIENEKLIYQEGSISFTEIDTARGKRVLLDLGVDAVLVVPRTGDGDYILTVQTRPGKSQPVYEFPSGGINAGENPEDAAARELLEEVGANGDLAFISKVEPLSGLVRFNIYIFSALIREKSDEDISLDENENVSHIVISETELMEKIKDMEVVDGYILLGLGALSVNK